MSESIEAIVAEYFHNDELTIDTWDAQGAYTEKIQLSKDEFRSALTRAAEGRWVKVSERLPEPEIGTATEYRSRQIAVVRASSKPSMEIIWVRELLHWTAKAREIKAPLIWTHWQEISLPTPPTD